jgi:hypothetical protein
MAWPGGSTGCRITGLPRPSAENRYRGTHTRMGLQWLFPALMLSQNYHQGTATARERR